MPSFMRIRRDSMINKEFWDKVARNWSSKSDGNEIPDIKPIDDDLGLDIDDDVIDELDDILADLEIEI